jgi:hypothetical protein
MDRARAGGGDEVSTAGSAGRAGAAGCAIAWIVAAIGSLVEARHAALLRCGARRMPSLRGFRASTAGSRVAAVAEAAGALQTALSRCGRRSGSRPALENSGSPEWSGKCRWRLPCIHDNALLRADGLDEGRADDAAGLADGEYGVSWIVRRELCLRVGANIAAHGVRVAPFCPSRLSRSLPVLEFPRFAES